MMELAQQVWRTSMEVMILRSGIRQGSDLELCPAVSMRVGSILYEWESQLIIYESGPSKVSLGYCFVRRDQIQFMKDLLILSRKEVITQEKPLSCGFKIRKVKVTSRESLYPRERYRNYMKEVSGVLSASVKGPKRA